MATRMRIGEVLVAANAITTAQLEEALKHPRKEGERLGDVLVSLGMVSETQLTQALSQQLAIPWVSLYHVDFSRPLLNLVPKELAERYCLVPVLVRKSKKRGEQLFVAMDDPTNDGALEQVAQYCGLTVKPMLASRSDIRAAIRVYYGAEPGEQAAAPAQAPPPPAPSSPKAASVPPAAPVAAPVAAQAAPPAPAVAAAPMTIPPDEVEAEPEPEEAAPSSQDSPEAAPEIEAREIIPKPKRGPAVPMVALTLLDGTTIQLPARRGRTPSSPATSETELTARDLVAALQAVGHGADASEILGTAPRWEVIVASLLSVLLKKGLIADWEFIEEYRKRS